MDEEYKKRRDTYRKRKLITLREAHVIWLRERNISLSRFVQDKIEKEMKKELIERGNVFDPNDTESRY